MLSQLVFSPVSVIRVSFSNSVDSVRDLMAVLQIYVTGKTPPALKPDLGTSNSLWPWKELFGSIKTFCSINPFAI